MPAEHGTAVWSTDDWRARATAWLDDQLGAIGIDRTGDPEQPHLRPWSTLLRVPTTAGTVWLKATGPETAFEVGLYELLERVAPEHVLTPIAVDEERGWVVLPDGGRPLAERASGSELIDALAAVLPRYAELQRALAPQVDELLALGVSDMRPAVMPERFDQALAALEGYVEGIGDDADRAAAEPVAGMRATVVDWCDRLAASPVPPSLDHNDLHPWNVLVRDGDGLDSARFYDWGDSVVAHPFASMMVALAFVEPDVDTADLHRLRDAYLEVFDDLGSHAELVDALELACRVGKIARALTWHRAISAMGMDAVDRDWARAPIEAMTALPDESYLARV